MFHELHCTYVHIKSWGLTTAYLGDMTLFYRNLSSSNELRQTMDQKAVHSTKCPRECHSFKAGSACRQRITGVQGRLRDRAGSSNGHMLMPSTQCCDDLPAKELCLHSGDRLTSRVMIKSKVIYSAIDYAELCSSC